MFRDNKGGFDIVIANPPYVRQEKISDLKPDLKISYPDVYDGVADLYVYFYARGLDLLRDQGMLAYISSNKFMKAGYGEKLRKLLAEKNQIQTLIDFGDQPVFEAIAYPCIVIVRKAAPTEGYAPLVLTVDSLEILEQMEEEIPKQAWKIPQVQLRNDGWTLERPKY